MDRRTILNALTVGLFGTMPLARRALAQHHTMAPAAVPTDARGVLVFAAATLKPALDAIVAAYRAKEGAEVTVAYGPTPALAKQIENGAPADIFLSADPVWMDYLAERRLIRRHTRADLLGNVLIVAERGSPSANPPPVIDRDFPLATLVGAGPLCMCNPADHPAGRYGKASLEALGLWDGIAGKIAIASDPQAAVVMVAQGEAPAALVFATDVKDVTGMRIAGTFPASSHPPIVYPIALTMAAPHAEAAERLLAYLRSPEARTLFDRYGYT
ncbi:molybdate transport system substrate-binding protein [Enhydrobacter aerosaccus]|uniref:Molybdate-binding protein ModA n=1 Tax=Enhydrobacter aerosaccus TaxID=225324 RepID=A0A1T4TBT8_9HYPH|nr:molybdate ABC transporter substrate-binding protein [Enhydrobacter aerosaccus]SKA38020.1 molybdate transport system substrate-binding protein [Enhydrobacter aerosaccus]